jgi:hypothetical protein
MQGLPEKSTVAIWFLAGNLQFQWYCEKKTPGKTRKNTTLQKKML